MKKIIGVLALTITTSTFAAGTVSLNTALKDCIKGGKDGPALQKVRVSGTQDTFLTITCEGKKAKVLYMALSGLSSREGAWVNDSGESIYTKFFGNLNSSTMPSQCEKIERSKDGEEINKYDCSIRVDVSEAVHNAL